MEQVVSISLLIAAIYLGAGLIFSIVFINMALVKVDEGARETSFVFKLLIIPGMFVFWPFFLKKWMEVKS